MGRRAGHADPMINDRAGYRSGVRSVTTSTEQIQAHVDEWVGWLTLNRADKRNAISDEMFASIKEVLAEWATDDEVRVVVVRGAGDQAFASGADLGQLDINTTGYPPPGARKGMTLTINKPVIAMIHGYCIGGGLMVAMDADIRIAADDAVFSIPAGPLGAGYPLIGVRKLVTLVGHAQASMLLFTGERIDANIAERLGLVNKTVPKIHLEAATKALASRIAQNAPLSLAAAKAAMSAVIDLPGSSFEHAQDLVDRCWVSEDFVEGRAAFGEKRTPGFTGR